MTAVNIADEVVGGVLQHAELLRGAVVIADAGTVESLRWSGALSVLLRDLGVRRLLATERLWNATSSGPHALLALLGDTPAWEPEGEEESQDAFVDHVVLLLSGFLWEYEENLQQLVRFGVVRHLTVCSSLSERAHECFDFEGHGMLPRKMSFDAFAASLAASNAFEPRHNQVEADGNIKAHSADDAGDEWGWGDNDAFEIQEEDATQATGVTEPRLIEGEVDVVYLPLTFVPLLAPKGPSSVGEPSLFVLSHPVCATAFPLLLTRVLSHQQAKAAKFPSGDGSQFPAYSHVKEVQAEHIPSEFRGTLKLVAYALGEILTNAQLDVKDRIYALGNTSLKIGHTLLKILGDLQEDLTTHTLQSHETATIVLLDRTSDLVSPCSFGVSLLDRILALIPQVPDDSAQPRQVSHKTRKGLHVTEIFPLHGCEPTPLSVSPPIEADDIERFMPSNFVSSIKWKGGATLCHPRASHGMSVFRSLAFRPAKLALRDLDKRLQEVEKELLLQRKITRSGSAKKPGEKPASTRGRDVVLRRISNVLEAGEPTNLEHTALIELGIIVLEALERMEGLQQRWDACRDRVARHVQLWKQGATEWIIPELADTIQRQLLASRSTGSKARETVTFHQLLALLVHAYALSGDTLIEDYTIQMIRNIVSEIILSSASEDPDSLGSIFPDLLDELTSFTSFKSRTSTLQGGSTGGNIGDDDEWGWDEDKKSDIGTTSSEENDDYELTKAKAAVERYLDRILSPLKECSQQFAKQFNRHTALHEVMPTPLIAQVCKAMVAPDAENTTIAELEHIVDASEQLARVGIDLLKSGFSRFGFGSGAAGALVSGSASATSPMNNSKVLIVFVVGGITFEEVQEVHAALQGDSQYQVIVGGTTVTNSEIILEQLFG